MRGEERYDSTNYRKIKKAEHLSTKTVSDWLLKKARLVFRVNYYYNYYLMQ